MSYEVRMVTALEQMLIYAVGLQEHTDRFERKEITQEQYCDGVFEFGTKIVATVQGALCVDMKRKARCQLCNRMVPASEIVRLGKERLCLPCNLDKYKIRPEDIPF